jgi:hypothetical protein
MECAVANREIEVAAKCSVGEDSKRIAVRDKSVDFSPFGIELTKGLPSRRYLADAWHPLARPRVVSELNVRPFLPAFG